MISLALRAGIKVEDIISDLKGIRGPMPTFTDKGTILSLPDAIAKILEEHVRSEAVRTPLELQSADTPVLKSTFVAEDDEPAVVMAKADFKIKERSMADYGMMPGCPECGEVLHLSEGCLSCHQCGFSRCS